MTIKKGEDWGTRQRVDDTIPVVSSDGAFADLFTVEDGTEQDGNSAGGNSAGGLVLRGPELVGLVPNNDVPATPRQSTNGLARTVGARGTRHDILGHERTVLPLDLGIVVLNPGSEGETRLVMASSLVVCGRFWSGVTEAAMNSAFLADWNVTPSGHPNDGRFDIVRAELSMSDRMKAKKRLVSGSHLPHPNIDVRRLREAEFRPAPTARVWIDGREHRNVALVSVVVVSDATSMAI